MKKRLIERIVPLLLLTLLFSLVLCSCNNNNQEATNQDSIITSNETDKSEGQGSTNNTDTSNNILTNTYKIPLQNVFVDVPDYHYISDGYTALYLEDGIKYFAITYDTSSSQSDLGNVFESNFMGFKADMGGYHHINKLNKYNSKTLTINGVDFFKADGSINCGENPTYDAYLTSYTFVLDNTACTIFGVVMDETQNESEISNVDAIIEEMVKTVRDHQ